MMEILSEKYGWLPSQIKNEDASDIEQYIEIISAKQKIEEARKLKQG